MSNGYYMREIYWFSSRQLERSKAMIKIITAGRTDLKDFFEKSGNFSGTKLTHTPFLVFLEREDAIHVHIVDRAEQLLTFSDEMKVMGQWQGNYRSDFFNLPFVIIGSMLMRKRNNRKNLYYQLEMS